MVSTMKVLITGASGFIGRNFLLNAPKNWNIYGLYHSSQDFPDFLTGHNLSHVQAVRCDLTQESQVKEFFSHENDFDLCVYLASHTNITASVTDVKHDLMTNVIGLITFLESFRGKQFIYFSSGAVYDGITGKVNEKMRLEPRIPYAIAKLSTENYIRFYHHHRKTFTSYIILRFFGAYGPYEPERKIYTQLVKTFGIDKRKEFTIRGDGTNLIDAMYIDDAITGLNKIIDNTTVANATLDFCVGKPLTITELLKEAAKILGIDDIKINYQGETAEPIEFLGNPDQMLKLYGFSPKTSLREGLLFLKDQIQKKQK